MKDSGESRGFTTKNKGFCYAWQLLAPFCISAWWADYGLVLGLQEGAWEWVQPLLKLQGLLLCTNKNIQKKKKSYGQILDRLNWNYKPLRHFSLRYQEADWETNYSEPLDFGPPANSKDARTIFTVSAMHIEHESLAPFLHWFPRNCIHSPGEQLIVHSLPAIWCCAKHHAALNHQNKQFNKD